MVPESYTQPDEAPRGPSDDAMKYSLCYVWSRLDGKTGQGLPRDRLKLGLSQGQAHLTNWYNEYTCDDYHVMLLCIIVTYVICNDHLCDGMISDDYDT